MDNDSVMLRPGTLWPALIERSRRALAGGALLPIDTEQRIIEDGGVAFLVRRVSSLAHKDQQRRTAIMGSGEKSRNPFLPYEAELCVGAVSPTHVCLLNKFNVIDHHLLIVTREFEHQETLLDRSDFAALAACMAEIDGLAFYNGGAAAGASQPHKHLQIVPLPLAAGLPAVPIEPLFESVRGASGLSSVPALPFRHGFAWIDQALFADPSGAAAALGALYDAMLAAVGVHGVQAGGETRQSAPYNLLLTRRWMLLVPRSRERFDSISVNALGFAGSLFVRDDEQLTAIERVGPLALLTAVAG